MDLIRKLCVQARERPSAQTMAEYALLLASVAIIVFAGYQKMGSTITTTLSAVDGKL